jgi:hypothetical protein
LLAGLSSCCGCSPEDGTLPARLDDKCFAVPDRYAEALDAPPFLPGLVSRLGYTHMRLLFTDSELAHAVPGYDSSTADTLVVSVAVATSAERSRARHLALNYDADVWRGSGFYEKRTVESLPKTPLLRICMTARDCLLVTADPRAPDFDSSKADLLVASCTIYESRPLRMCVLPVVADERGWILTIDLREENVRHRNDVSKYVLMKIDSWQRPC